MFTVDCDSAKGGQLPLDNGCSTISWVLGRETYANAEIALKNSSERLGCGSWHTKVLIVFEGISHN